MRIRIMTVLFCAASILSLWAVAAAKPPESPYTIDTPYEFPVVPGTQEWIDMSDTLARRKACEVPDEIIQHMTTDALFLTVLNHPFLSDMYAFNSVEQGYVVVRRRFADLREFERRPDYLDVLSQYCETRFSLPEEEKTFEDRMADTLYYIYTGIFYHQRLSTPS